ncbi:hypothetical protein EDC01DRAFT_760202 [Geopyxis carbonaria]|nr:hypothetical protein EDC01DRAFT_760202 [Geopyxis carbonaria]
MAKGHSIDDFFLPITPPKNKPVSTIKPGDGFEPEELLPAPWTPKPGRVYKPMKIAALRSGLNGSIMFTGRIVNFRDHERTTKSPTSAKLLLQITLQDDTGAIDVKFWVTTDVKATLARMKLGVLVTVYTNFVDTLAPKDIEKSASTNGLVVSLSDNDPNVHVEVHEETEDNWADLRCPPGVNGDVIEDLIPLKAYLDGGNEIPGVQLLVCVKWKGEKKTIPRKDGGGSFVKQDIGIFDDTMEAVLVLYGAAATSTSDWVISKTILLITTPTLKLWGRDVQLQLDRKSMIAIDPILRDAQWLRTYAKKVLRRPDLCQPFPDDEFDWEEGFYGETRLKWTFEDLDTYSRDVEIYIDLLPGRQCVGYLNVLVMEMNLAPLYVPNLLSCGFMVFTNEPTADCKKCQNRIPKLLPNPNIVGKLADETGSINGKHMIWSERAWCSFLGRTVLQLTQADMTLLEYIDDFFRYISMTLMFGWSEEVGKIAVWDVLSLNE